MTEYKHFNKIVIFFIVIAMIVVSVCWTKKESAEVMSGNVVQLGYADSVFDKRSITTVNIEVDENEWQDLLDNASDEEYICVDVTVNGVTYNNVGIRAKGNTSLSQVVNDENSDRYSFKIKFDKYVTGQTCDGLDKMALNNIISDSTYMKEYLSYDLMDYLGINTPLYAFTDVRVNGETWGLYLGLECLEESFAQRVYGTNYGSLYKVEGSMGGGRENDSRGSDGSDLIYTDDEHSSYSAILDNPSYSTTDEDSDALIKAIKNLNEGTDLEQYVDIEQSLKYIAANTVLVNLDSYFSNMKHNYYLYEEDGKIAPVPWDYNLSFAGFQSNDAGSAVNFPIDTPVSGVEMSERPLVEKLLEVEEYMEQYHDYLQEIISGYFDNGTFKTTVNYLDQMITNYVQNDPTAFYTYQEYQKGVQTLKQFGTLRALSVQEQLNGTIPSTTEGQKKDSGKLIDASSISISDMGTQGGGGREAGFGGMPSGRQEPDQDEYQQVFGGGQPPDMNGNDIGRREGGPRGGPGKDGDRSGGLEAGMKNMEMNSIMTEAKIAAACGLGLILAMVVVKRYKRRRIV